MSTNATLATAIIPARNGERAHRLRLAFGYFLAIALILGLLIYGWDYYILDAASRPFSPKHGTLRPSSAIGIRLGFLGVRHVPGDLLISAAQALGVAGAAGQFAALARYPCVARVVGSLCNSTALLF